MAVLEEGNIQIHTENIFPIIKKAVYSDHEIFLRELVSNGVDAISKRRMASLSGECEEGTDPKIEITINRELKTLTIADNGIGMNSDEIKKYINQVAFSSAEEFLEKYKTNEESIIGHFGLGFYSSFMVAKNVELISKSALKDSKAIKWSCDGSPKFSMVEDSKETVGTEVILHLMEEELEYIEPSRIKTLIKKYCDFMPVKVLLEGEVINKMETPWKKHSKDLDDKDYVSLYQYLYPFQGDPLIWIHLNTDYPYKLEGILYFPKITGRADWENGEIKLYCNQVFVSDSLKEIVPRYLLPLRGVIDSPDIPLNVSRSALQTDRRVKSIGNFISKKVADTLKKMKEEKPERYAEVWESLSAFIKIGSIEDEKFADQVSDIILFNTLINSKDTEEIISVKEKNYTTLTGYRNRIDQSRKNKVLYCTDEISQSNALSLWKEQGAEVILAETVVDTQFIPWLENRFEELTFQRVDAELDDNLKDKESEILDKDGSSQSDSLREVIKDALNNEKVTIQIQSLKAENSPAAMILLPEQMRRISDMGALMEQKMPGLPEYHVLLVNPNHPLVEGLMKMQSRKLILGSESSSSQNTNQIAKDIAKYLYDLAKLSVGGLEPREINGFQTRSARLMSKLIEKSL